MLVSQTPGNFLRGSIIPRYKGTTGYAGWFQTPGSIASLAKDHFIPVMLLDFARSVGVLAEPPSHRTLRLLIPNAFEHHPIMTTWTSAQWPLSPQACREAGLKLATFL